MTQTVELCGHETANGPCSMKKGHAASFHRNRKYPELKWVLKNAANKQLDAGTGVNLLTYAISKHRISGTTLRVEIEC